MSNSDKTERSWLALMIGNSRLHWGWFKAGKIQETWDITPLSTEVTESLIADWHNGKFPKDILPDSLSADFHQIPLYLASVVPSQTALWQTYQHSKVISLKDIPLLGVYSTLGVDRALALLGAGKTLGFPVLTIDAGTALTYTGADIQGRIVGGAILPGLRLQLKSLAQHTAALPFLETESIASLPPRFAINTAEAIQSGIIYTLLAGIRDFIEAWWRQFPNSKISLTGGDRNIIFSYLQTQFADLSTHIIVERNLIFWGMQSLVEG